MSKMCMQRLFHLKEGDIRTRKQTDHYWNRKENARTDRQRGQRSVGKRQVAPPCKGMTYLRDREMASFFEWTCADCPRMDFCTRLS